MCYIANIITKTKLKVSELIYVTDNIGNADMSLPTLIVGWELTKELLPNYRDILSKQIDKNLYWTFSKREDCDTMAKDITIFTIDVINQIKNENKYTYFNPILYGYNKNKHFLLYIDNSENKTIYIKNDFIYIYCNNKTIGVNMNDLYFIGIEKDKILKRLSINSKNKIITKTKPLKIVTLNHLKNCEYLIPFLYRFKTL